MSPIKITIFTNIIYEKNHLDFDNLTIIFDNLKSNSGRTSARTLNQTLIRFRVCDRVRIRVQI